MRFRLGLSPAQGKQGHEGHEGSAYPQPVDQRLDADLGYGPSLAVKAGEGGVELLAEAGNDVDFGEEHAAELVVGALFGPEDADGATVLHHLDFGQQEFVARLPALLEIFQDELVAAECLGLALNEGKIGLVLVGAGEGDAEDEEIRAMIDELVLTDAEKPRLTVNERLLIGRELFYSVRRLDILQDLVDDPDVVEIMVNGPDRIFVEKGGVLQRLPRGFSSPEKLDDVIQQIAGRCNRVINERSPIVDARLSDGSRVNAVISPAALNGPILTIRRFPKEPITMDKLIRLGSLTEEAALFLEDLVRAGYSSVISGGTSAARPR